ETVEKAVLDIKVSLLGDSSVGKSSITSSFHEKLVEFEPKATICFEFSSKLVSYGDGSKVRYTIYDTAGQERFRSVMPNCIRNMDAVIVVYDITNKEGKRKAEFSNSFFLETSAVTGEKVDAIFQELSTTIREKKINELFHGARIPLHEMAVRLSANTLQQRQGRSPCC
ncbi:unnamed protein product, partial [Candidula unifasciata]